MKILLVIVFSFFYIAPTNAQMHYVDLSEFKFNGLYGQYRDDTTTVFSLVCNNWKGKTFKADSLISKWLIDHPDATFRPVCSFSYYRNAKRKTFTYGWIVSSIGKADNLNVYLVRHGSCTAKSMLWAASAKDMYPHSDVYSDPGIETKIFINESTYREFLKRLKEAGKTIH